MNIKSEISDHKQHDLTALGMSAEAASAQQNPAEHRTLVGGIPVQLYPASPPALGKTTLAQCDQCVAQH